MRTFTLIVPRQLSKYDQIKKYCTYVQLTDAERVLLLLLSKELAIQSTYIHIRARERSDVTIVNSRITSHPDTFKVNC